MKLVDRVGAITETALNLLMVTKLMRPASVEALKKTGLIGSTGGGLDNPFSIEKERKNIYSGKAELEPDERVALDDFVTSLGWWERLEFFEKFGDYDTTVPKLPRIQQSSPQKQYSQMANNLGAMLNAGKVGTGYDVTKMHSALQSPTGMGLFKKSVLNPYYDLFRATEKLNLKKLFDKIKQTDFQAIAQKTTSLRDKLADAIEKSANKGRK